MTDRREPFLDLDAVEEDHSLVVRIGKVDYPIRSHLDIPLEEVDESMRIYEEIKGKPWHQQLQRGRRQVQILIPTLPEAAVNRLTGRQLVRIMGMVIGLSPVPEGLPAEPPVPFATGDTRPAQD